jgi:hypothetical protein
MLVFPGLIRGRKTHVHDTEWYQPARRNLLMGGSPGHEIILMSLEIFVRLPRLISDIILLLIRKALIF